MNLAQKTVLLALMLSISWMAGLPRAADAAPTTGVTNLSQRAEPLPQKTAVTEGRIDVADLRAWLDGMVPYAMSRGRIAGGVIVVVMDGRVILQQGYGYADVARRVPVDAQQTMFRIGSISKLFTWTAVMQLVEQGRIDLDRDIATYLDLPLASDFAQPITMRHLMTHTAGFEERIKGTLAASSGQFMPLREYVKTAMPPRMEPPGEVPAYSNYGAALAGYIIERVTGEDFNAYLQRAVFTPLGMDHSTARQPLPESFSRFMSQGYKNSAAPPWYFELIPAPAGGISASGPDMAQFMIAHLVAGKGRDGALLQADAATKLHDSRSTPMPGLNGVSLGFVVNSDRPRIIGHGGSTQVFHSDLKLFMESGVGWFAAFNSTGKDRAVHELLKALGEGFAQRYFMSDDRHGAIQASIMPTAAEHARQIAAAGPYERSRGRADTFFGSLSSLMGQQSFIINADDTISLLSAVGADGIRKRWREVAPYVWRDTGGSQQLVARVVAGRVQAIGMDSLAGTGILLPVPVWRSSAWILPTLLMATTVLLATAIYSPIAALVRRRCVSPLTVSPLTSSPRASLARGLSRAAVAVILLLLTGWGFVLQQGLNDFSLFTGALDPWIRSLHALGWLAAMLSTAAVWNVWLSWRTPQPLSMRLGNSAIAVACCVATWFAFAFDLVTLGVDY